MKRRPVTRREFMTTAGKAGLGAVGACSIPAALGWGARPAMAQGSPRPFKIGYAMSLTGVFGKEGGMVRDAYELWKEKVNAEGGIEVKGKRHPVETVYYDDKSVPATAAKLSEKLISDDKVDLILGSHGSGHVFAASAVTEKARFPTISGGASANRLFERGFKYYFSTLGKTTDEVRGAVDVFSIANPKPRTAAIIGSDILFTALAVEGFKQYAAKNQIEVVHQELFPVSLEDYNSMLNRVKQKNPDVLFVGSLLFVALKVMRAAKEVDFNPKAIAFGYGPTIPDFVRELGKDAEYAISASEWVPGAPYEGPFFGSARDFSNLFQKRYGREPDYLEAASAGAALALHLGIQKAELTPGVDDAGRERLTAAIQKLDVMTFYGRIKFGADGAAEAHPPLAVQIQDGKKVAIFPENVAEGKLRYPMKPWKARG